MAFRSVTQPLCHYCGKAIRKYTKKHWFGSNMEFYNHPDRSPELRAYHHGEKPTTREQAQRCLNQQIVSMRWSSITRDGDLLPRDQQYICEVTVWDGETYDDEFFCSGDHAKAFGYIVAREGRCTRAYNEALARQRAKKVDAA